MLFQLGWFGCVLAKHDWAVLAAVAIALLQYALLTQQKHEAVLLCIVVAWGFMQDAMLMHLHVFNIPQTSWPPGWLLALWLLFGTTLTRSLRWFQSKLWLAALAGAIAGPLSYLAGARLGAIDMSITDLPLLSLAWAICTPAFLWLAKQLTAGDRI